MHEAEKKELVGLLVIVVALAAYYYRPRWKGSTTAHGTARWMSDAMFAAAGMLAGQGLILGRTLSGKLIRLPHYCHVLLVGGTGSGKGVSVIIPQLLSYIRGSCICFDTKGDLTKTCARARMRMGQRIIWLAPFNGGTDAFNPLAPIRAGPRLIDEARALAEAIVVRLGTEPDQHWNESAVMVICAILVLVLMRFEGDERSLNSVREIVSDEALLDAATAQLCAMGGIPARMGNQLRGLQDKERSGVLSTVGRHLSFLDSELVVAAVARSTFDPAIDLCGRRGTTAFVQIPPEFLEAQRGLLRCWISTMVRVIGQMGSETRGEVLLLLDEASALNGLSAVEEALVRGRSSGLRMLLAYQSDSQVRAAFKDKPTLIHDNCSTHIYLGASSYETAELISKRVGDATITVESANEQDSTSWQPDGCSPNGTQRSRSSSRNWSVLGRALVRPEEILAMSNEFLLAFVQGKPPILARRIKWFCDPLFRRPLSPPVLWYLLLALAIGLAVVAFNH